MSDTCSTPQPNVDKFISDTQRVGGIWFQRYKSLGVILERFREFYKKRFQNSQQLQHSQTSELFAKIWPMNTKKLKIHYHSIIIQGVVRERAYRVDRDGGNGM